MQQRIDARKSRDREWSSSLRQRIHSKVFSAGRTCIIFHVKGSKAAYSTQQIHGYANAAVAMIDNVCVRSCVTKGSWVPYMADRKKHLTLLISNAKIDVRGGGETVALAPLHLLSDFAYRCCFVCWTFCSVFTLVTAASSFLMFLKTQI